MGEWKEKQLGNLLRIKHGYAFAGEHIVTDDNGKVLVTPGNFAIGGGWKPSYKKFYKGEVPEDYILKEGDLVVTMTDLSKDVDTLGYSARVTRDGRRTFLHNQRIGLVTEVSDEADPNFLYWVMRTKEYHAAIVNTASGSTVSHTSPSRIYEYVFDCPELDEQRAIAAVLSTMEAKIDLLQRQNKTLDEMAQAIFKEWIEARNAPNASGDKWESTVLGKVVNVLEAGRRPAGGVSGITSGVPSIGAESIVGLGHFDYAKTKYVPAEYYAQMQRGKAQDMDVLLYKDGGRPGEFEPHATLVGRDFPFAECCINEHVFRIRTEPTLPQSYLYFWLTSDGIMDEMRSSGTGAAIPGLNSSAVKDLSLIVPPTSVLERFAHDVDPLVARILDNCKQTRTLATLRDTLLPKLMSGEVRVEAATQSV